MADDNSKDENSGGGVSIVGILLASVVAAGGGVFLGWSQFGKHEPAAQHAPKDAHGKEKKGEQYTEGARVRDLLPITTNLAGTPAAWIRLEASVVFTDPEPAEKPTDEEVELLRNINEDVVAYLRTVSLTQLHGPSGFQSMREDLDERVRIRSEGKVKEFVVQSMILE